MRQLFILLLFSLVTLIANPTGAETENGSVLSAMSLASARGTRWLIDFVRTTEFFTLSEIAHVSVAFNLLFCSDKKCYVEEEMKNTFKVLGKFKVDNLTTNELIWYIFACKSLPLCTKKDCKAAGEKLIARLAYYPEKSFNHPAQLSYALMGIGISGNKIPWIYVSRLIGRLGSVARHGYDTYALQMMALSAYYRQNSSYNKDKVHRELSFGLVRLRNILAKSAGNEITTASVLQAKIAVEKTLKMKQDKIHYVAIKKLLASQSDDGSFGGNLLTTTTVLVPLSGFSFIDLQDVSAEKLESEEDKTILGCVAIKFLATSTQNPPTQYIRTRNGSTALDILQKAANKHPCFQFTSRKTGWGVSITSICGVLQDHLNKRYWMIYSGDKMAPHGVSTLGVEEGKCINFVYKTLKFK